VGTILKSLHLKLPLAVASSLLLAVAAVADDNWGADLEIYGWLPNIELQSEDGSTGEITRDDIINNLDITALWKVRVRKGRWSLASDFIYLDISDNTDLPLIPKLPELANLSETGLKAWIITPNIGYTILQNDRQKIELYAGARYFWIEVEATIEIDPISPGDPPISARLSPTISSWDGIVGARGLYYLTDKWYIPYSVNVGAGDSDLTWSAQTGFGYKFSKLDAAFGWRYLHYDIGSDTILKELNLNGPFVGVILRW
jgi:hypothetical protein